MTMSPRPFRNLRLSTTLALGLGLALTGAACDKGGDASNKPGAGGEPTGKAGKDAKANTGADYAYAAEGFTVTSNMKVKFEVTSSEGAGAAEIEARSLLEATPAKDKDKLQVHGKVLELVRYEGSGQLDPEFMKKQAEKEGGDVFDIVESLRSAESWVILNRKGQVDGDATKALPQNETPDPSSAGDFGLFNLPDLPPVDLVEGEKTKLPTKDDERQLPFGMIPVEVDETWTLRSISADRIAEFDVTSELGGATEISAGGGTAMVSMLEEGSYTVHFNLETKLPVSISGYSQSEISIDVQGQSMTFATNSELEGSFTAGAAQ